MMGIGVVCMLKGWRVCGGGGWWMCG